MSFNFKYFVEYNNNKYDIIINYKRKGIQLKNILEELSKNKCLSEVLSLETHDFDVIFLFITIKCNYISINY